MTTKGTIGILTGGGDVPGLNPAIRAITIRARREGYRVLGLRRGWAGLVEMAPDDSADNSSCYRELSEDAVNRAARTGGTFLHTSRTRPSHLPKAAVPEHLKDEYTDETNDATAAVLRTLDHPNLPRLQDFGVTPDGEAFLVFDWIEGTTLDRLGEIDGNHPARSAVSGS